MAKKASVKITGIGQARDNALKFLNQSKKDSDVLNIIGQLTSDQIRNKTRSRSEEYKQPDIKESTIGRRKKLIKAGNAFGEKIVTAKKSNLSMSGQLLGAITHRINNSLAEITIFLTKPRTALRGIRKEKLENNKTNVEIKNDLETRGRRFLFISEKLKAQLESRIAEELRKKLDLYNKIKRKFKS